MVHTLRPRKRDLVLAAGTAMFIGQPLQTWANAGAVTTQVDFSRDVLPILGDKCFHCHGPDVSSRKAGLRLDEQAAAFKDLGGYRAIEPGHPEKSELWKRLVAKDPEDAMPPPDSKKAVTAQQIDVLRRWILEGAKWGQHWAFVPPLLPPLPQVDMKGWAKNPIDMFVAARHQTMGLTHAPVASKETLIRRVTLDLTGLPPTVSEVDSFLNDTRPDAYERLVARLLDSSRYGEQQARHWLDAVRYGDTHGLHHDNKRAIWPYRDFVVRAFNENLPFDKFTLWQLAGDLLPNPTRDQTLATGFLRCNVTTNEQGSIEEEVKAHNVRDRVETFSTVYLGLTMGCAACHDHKYDPIRQKDFYAMSAFFDNGQDEPMDLNIEAPPPFIRLSTPEQDERLATFDKAVAQVDGKIKEALTQVSYVESLTNEGVAALPFKEHPWSATTSPSQATFAKTGNMAFGRNGGKIVTTTKGLGRVDVVADSKALVIGQGDTLFVDVFLDPGTPPTAVSLDFLTDSWGHIVYWGPRPLALPGRIGQAPRNAADPVDVVQRPKGRLPAAGRWHRVEIDPTDLRISVGAKIRGVGLLQKGGQVRWAGFGVRTRTPQEGKRFGSLLLWQTLEHKKIQENIGTSHPKEVRKALAKPPQDRSSQERQLIAERFYQQFWDGGQKIFEPLLKEKETLERDRQAFVDTIPHSLIYAERPQRPTPTYILLRGEYDQHGEVVTPQTPQVLPGFSEQASANRMSLATWLLDPKHPLTSRVTVNRVWQQHFGTGIVKTAWDFGLQGDAPSHPELLDWLATTFIDDGWNMKALHRMIVTSQTYKQSSWTRLETQQNDPENRYLTRGPRFRLDAEVIRDAALFASGLLVERLAGEGARPYQPKGLWEEIALISPISNTRFYNQDEGDGLFRRSLYTFWKRLSPPPSLAAFDAPSREICTVRRERTNTPLQALVLMNDPQFVEAARMLGQRILREGGVTDDDRVSYGFRLVTARKPGPDERALLLRLLGKRRDAFARQPHKAAALMQVGTKPVDRVWAGPELAAWTMVASALFNLDEAVTLE